MMLAMNRKSPDGSLLARRCLALLLVLSMALSGLPAQAIAAAGGAASSVDARAPSRGLLPSTESFQATSFAAHDTDGNGKSDALEASYTVRTTALQEQVKVLAKALDSSGNTVKYHYDNFTALLVGNQPRNWTFQAYYTGYYRISMALYDSDGNLEATTTSSAYYLDTGVERRWIAVGTTSLDLDNDSFEDDVEVKVTNWTSKAVSGAEVWINGTFVGKTNASGLIRGKDYPKGWYTIDAFSGTFHNATSWYSEGDGSVMNGLMVKAEPQDFDGDTYKDDVLVTVRNALNLPVANARITINGTSSGTTDAQGQLEDFNFARGWYTVNATKLTQTGSARFYSEGQAPGRENNEFFASSSYAIVDADKDGRFNDVRATFDIDVMPPVVSEVTVYAILVWDSNGTEARNQSLTYKINGTQNDPRSITLKNATYGDYVLMLVLYDSYDNLEGQRNYFFTLSRPTNHINIETGVYAITGAVTDALMNDLLFSARRMNDLVPNVTVTLLDSDGFQVGSDKTDSNGQVRFDDLRLGAYNWTAKDDKGRLVEKGLVTIGPRVQVQTDLGDLDGDGYYADFMVSAYNNVGRAVNTVAVNVWSPDGTQIVFANRTVGGAVTVFNLSKGTYSFNCTYLGIELARGTFYSYGSVFEPFSISARTEAADLDKDGRYDDVTVTVVDNDDSPVDGATVSVDGATKGTSDINGALVAKDLAWGVHEVKATYSDQTATVPFFSEGTSAHTASWALLVLSDGDGGLEALEKSGTTNSSVVMYYSEAANPFDPVSRLYIVLKGAMQEVVLSRANSSMKPDQAYYLASAGVIRSIVGYAMGHFPATATAIAQSGTPSSPGGLDYFYEHELVATSGTLKVKWGLASYAVRPWDVAVCYEVRTAFSYAVGVASNDETPLEGMARLIGATPSTTARQLGEYIVANSVGDSKNYSLLVDLGKIGALATQVDSLSSALIGAYPAEGWHVQDARNASSFNYLDNQYYRDGFVFARKLAVELGNRLGSADLRSKAGSMRGAVDAATLKVGSTGFGLGLVFPNATWLWNSPFMQTYINDSSMSKNTHWNEFLDAFWEFKLYTIQVNATVIAKDADGRANDVRIYVNDTYDKPVAGANVTIDFTYRNNTDANGYYEAKNFTRGAHYVNVSFRGSDASTFFIVYDSSVIPNNPPRVAIIEPNENARVNGTVTVSGNASDPDAVVLYVEVRVDGGAWNRTVGRENWTYRWDTTPLSDGRHLIEARSYDGDLYSPINGRNVTVTHEGQFAEILLVIDDGGQGNEVYYETALRTGPRAYDVYRVPVGEDGPSAARLKYAKYVVWFTGEMAAGTLTYNDRDALADYLDSGGRLFLTGQDIGRDLTSNGQFVSGFMRDYLKANYIRDNSDVFNLIGVPDEYISGGINVSIEGGTGARNQNYPDEVSPRSTAATAYLYNVTSEAAIKYGGATFRVVYFAFGFEGISTSQDRSRTMQNVLDWLASDELTTTNRPPVVDAGPAVTGSVDESLTFHGSATDEDGLVALYEWDFDGDGTYDWRNATSGVATWTPKTAGNFTAKLRATDNAGEFGTDTTRVTVRPLPPNARPVASAGDDITVIQCDPVEFVAAGYDPDGRIVLYEWDYDGDGIYDSFSPSPGTRSYTYADPAAYDAVLRVTDDRGANGTDVREVIVLPLTENKPPVADAGPDITVVAGTDATLNGKGTDPDGTIKLYKWDFEGDGVYDWTSTTTGVAHHVYDRAGTYTARLLVIDIHDSAATDTARVTVTASHVNKAPVANAGGPSTLQAVAGEEVGLDGTGTDEDGLITLFEWDFDSDGTYDWSSAQERTAYHTYAKAGLYVAVLRVTDNEGATGTDSRRVSVSSPSPPNVGPTADAHGPYDGRTGEDVRLAGTGTDTDGQISIYQWDFESDGRWDYESATTGTTDVIYDRAGAFTATLRVTDDDGATATDTAQVTIVRANALPTVKVDKPVANEKVKGYVVFKGTAGDDMGVVKVQVKLDSGAWEDAQGTTSWTFDFNADSHSAGSHTLRVRAVDTSSEYSAETTVQFTTEKAKKAEPTPGLGALMALAAVGVAAVAATAATTRRRRD